MRSAWVFAVAGASILGVSVIACLAKPPARLLVSSSQEPNTLAIAAPSGDADGGAPPLVHAAPIDDHEVGPSRAAPVLAPLAGLDLSRMSLDKAGFAARAEGGVARLTLDPELQRTALGLLRAHHIPEAAAILMDVATGRLLVYASHVERGSARDLCVEAKAPSASVFKIITSAALIEDAHLGPDTRQCYSGGESRILAANLIDNPARDRQCTTLASALGHSINTVFARLASKHLSPAEVDSMARRFGYGQGVPFDVPVEDSSLHIPSEPLEFARTAAGFWNTTLSPLEAVEISAIVASGGESVRPEIVDKVVSPADVVLWSAPSAPSTQSPRRVIARETADDLGAMMDQTISEGTCRRAFHDPRGRPFLPGIDVAGKTGTLTGAETHRYYTWFTGFAPSRPVAGMEQVAVAVLVVNGPSWEVKANVIARDVLRSYFASRGAAGVTQPIVTAIARLRARRR